MGLPLGRQGGWTRYRAVPTRTCKGLRWHGSAPCRCACELCGHMLPRGSGPTARRAREVDQVHLGAQVVLHGGFLVAAVAAVAVLVGVRGAPATAGRRVQRAPLLQRDREDGVRAR